MTNVERNYDDFTHVPNLIFKSMGYDFLDTPRRVPSWQRILLRIYWILCLLSHWYMVYYLILRTVEWDTLAGNPTTIMRYAIVYFFVLNSDMKFIIFMHHRRRLRELNNRMRALYPKDDCERRAYRVNDFYWPRIARYGVYYYYFVVFVVVVGPILQATGTYIYQRFTSSSEIKFIYLSTFPMERIKSMTPLTYAFSQAVDFVFTHFVMNINLGTDIWMMCLCGQLCMHFAHLGRQLEAYRPNRHHQLEDCEFLVSIVRKHQLLFTLHMELDNIFGMLMAYNLFSTATTLCCVAFYSILQGLNREGFGFLLFFFSCSAQFYMVCYYGQLLIDLSQSIALAAYIHTWYEGSPTYRKYLLLIMQRAQRPVMLSAKGVIIISLVTFTNLMNMTYRFFAIIRRVLGK
ncbi:odorant receptor 49a [Drosophila novamexicana]|uniref:odorant receptor 49a n=1 Tax=Drosophila novamexicana TaxID=47314 RepID=UPI0011E5B162|nr:odorant receptor 49a [Drosophila novamexicana]